MRREKVYRETRFKEVRVADAGVALQDIPDAGIANARNSVASPRCHNARLGACV